MQRRNPERRAQQEMRRIAQAETGGRYSRGPGAGFGGVVGAVVGGEWTSFGRVGITTLDAPFYVAPPSSGAAADPPGRVGLTTLGEPFRVA